MEHIRSSFDDYYYYYQSQYEIWEWIQMQPTKPHCFMEKNPFFQWSVSLVFFPRVDSCGVLFFLSISFLVLFWTVLKKPSVLFFWFGKLNYYGIETRESKWYNQCRMGRGKSYYISPIFSSCTLNALNWKKKMFPILLLTQKRVFSSGFFLLLCLSVDGPFNIE